MRAVRLIALRGLAGRGQCNGRSWRRALDILKQAETSAQQTSDVRLLAHIQLVRGVSLHRLGRSR